MSLREIVAAFRRGEPPEMASSAAQADLVEIFKRERRMELKWEGRVLKRYRVALGRWCRPARVVIHP